MGSKISDNQEIITDINVTPLVDVFLVLLIILMVTAPLMITSSIKVALPEAKTGERREGSYYAFFSFFQKAATGVVIWAMGQALAATGYITPEQGQALPVQPDAAVNTIRIFMGPIPAVMLLLAILFAWRLKITRESHRATLEVLASKE